MSGLPAASDSRTGFYGFGTNVGYDYSGRVRLSHSGGFAQGAATSYFLLLDQQLGIVVLTNGMPIGVPEAVGAYFLDLVVGGEIENDWFALYEPVFAKMYVNPSELAGKKPPPHPRAARPDSFYTGTYHSDFYGTVTVIARGGALHVLMPPRPTDYPLEHWDGSLFALFPVGENALGISAATFAPNQHNDLSATLTLEYYNNFKYPDGTGIGVFVRQ